MEEGEPNVNEFDTADKEFLEETFCRFHVKERQCDGPGEATTF